MEGIGAAASILAIGAAGVQVSIKLAAFANQVGTAPNRIRSIANDVSLTANVLQQLSELANKNDNDKAVNVFNEDGLATTQASADACKTVFQELDDVLRSASQQIRENRNKTSMGQKIILSKHERMKWPFLQPKIDSLRTALRDARETLMLMLLVTTLGYMKKQTEMTGSSISVSYEESEVVSAILALHSQGLASGLDIVREPKPRESGIKPRLPPKDGSPAIECSGLTSQARRIPHHTQELRLSSSTSTNSIFDAPDRRDSSETHFTQASTQSSLPQTPIFPPRLRNRAKREDEHEVPDRELDRDLNNTTPQKARDQTLQNQSILETTASAETTMEAWMVMPRVFRADGGCGYDLRWGMNVWSLDSTEMKRLVREMSGWRKPDTLKQLASLTSMEREVVNCYLAQRGNSLNDNFTVKSVGFRSMEPTVEPNTRMPWRSIQVLIARTRPVRILPSAKVKAETVTRTGKVSKKERNVVNDVVPPDIEDGDVVGRVGYEPSSVTVGSNGLVSVRSLPMRHASSTSSAYYSPQPAETSQQSTQPMSTDGDPPLRVVQERSKPQCWDHGCNGRNFSTYSNLLRHRREASGVPSKSICSRCGAEFTRATARDAHCTKGTCTKKSKKKARYDQPEQLEESDISVINKKHAVMELNLTTRKEDGLTKPHDVEQDFAECLEYPEKQGVRRQAKVEGPFAGLKRLLVVAGGIVVDQDGNIVAHINEGNPVRLVGHAVDEGGDIVDKYGNIKGRAKPIGKTQTESQVSLEDRTGKRVQTEGVEEGAEEYVEDDVEEGVELGVEKLQILDSEDPAAQEKYQGSERDVVESLAKEEGEMEEIGEEAMVEISGGAPRPWKCGESSCEYHERGWPTEQERDLHMTDQHPSSLPTFKCNFPFCSYETKRENDCQRHMKEPHRWEPQTATSDSRIPPLSFSHSAHSSRMEVVNPAVAVPEISATETRVRDWAIPAADGKRERNATASHRFRRRRGGTERENAYHIEEPKPQIPEMAEQRDSYDTGHYRADLVGADARLIESFKEYSLGHSADKNGDSECIEGIEEDWEEEEVQDQAENAPAAEESAEGEAERIIRGLLSRYTTLYDA